MSAPDIDARGLVSTDGPEHHRLKVGRVWVDIYISGELDVRGVAKLRAYMDLIFQDIDEEHARDQVLAAGSAIESEEREADWLACRAADVKAVQR